MEINRLSIDQKTEQIIVDHCPSAEWSIFSEKQNVMQKQYELKVTKEEKLIWSSGIVKSQECIGIPCGGEYEPFSQYVLNLKVWTEDGDFAQRTLPFQTGRLNLAWQMNWISDSDAVDDDMEKGVTCFQWKMKLQKKVKKAFITASALGCYDLYLNGKLVDDRYFAPGYTQYTRRVQYQTYDVTEQLKEIKDAVLQLDAEVAGGWYSGRLGLVLDGNRFGKKRAFAMELELFYEDGTSTCSWTDETWRTAESEARKGAGFFDGEIYHAKAAKKETWNWKPARILASVNQPNCQKGVFSFDEKEWQCIPELVEDEGEAVRAHEMLQPVIISRTEKEIIFDAGRNLAGIVCIRNLKVKEGTRILIRHGEVLDKGSVYTGNLRTAKAELDYTCKEGMQSYEPRFTYMGFRYFSVTVSEPMEIQEENFYVKELYSDMEITGTFQCSNELLSQLQKNILTSQKANFIDIPTDCPQRDERCGWTGDITTFASTAAYNMNCYRFLSRWLADVNILQEDNGKGFAPYVVPDNAMGRKKGGGMWGKNEHTSSSAVWADAAVILPWCLYQSSGNKKILEKGYAGMKAQIESVRKSLGYGNRDKNYIWKEGLGDWLAPGESIVRNVLKAKWIATAYWAYSVQLVSQTAALLGNEEDATEYEKLFRRICEAFRSSFVRRGHIKKGFQTIYALCICFGILKEEELQNAADDLVQDVRKRENHLSTGFAGTPYLAFALADSGNMDTAYDLLLQDTYPSWLYPVKTGATSIWERWDSLKPDGSINSAGDMVSFNHYSYGAIGDFLYRRVCGLEAITPGYQHFRIAPKPGGDLTWADTEHKSPYGTIKTRWEIRKEDGVDWFYLKFTIPANTTAEIVLPGGRTEKYGSGSYCVKERAVK